MELNTSADYAHIEQDQTWQNSSGITQTLNQYEKPDIGTSGSGGEPEPTLPLSHQENRIAFGEGEVVGFDGDTVKLLITDSDGQQEIYHIVKKTFSGWVDSETITEGARYKVNLVEQNSRKQLEFLPYPAPFITSHENVISKEQLEADINALRDSLGH
jgi:hypothetical protein